MSKVRVICSLLALTAITLTLSACNTMEGLGKDTKKLGDNLESAATRNK